MNRKDYLRQSIDIIDRAKYPQNSMEKLTEEEIEKIPEKGDSFKFKGYTLIFNGEKWSGTTEEGTRVRISDNRQNAATRKWRESLEKPRVSGEPSDEVRRAAFSALKNTGLRAKESQVAVKRASSVLGADATEEEMIRTAFKYKDQEPSPEDVKKEPEDKKASGKSLSDKLGPDKKAEDATADQIIQHIQDEYGMDREEAENIARKAGVNIGTEEPIGQDAAEEVTKEVTQGVEAGSYEERGSDIPEITLELYGKFLPSLKSAIVAGKEAKDNKTIDQLSDIEKMGLTVLISMNKIR
ncbi:hypothetical protein LCGC14_0973340 [marine sediment metagenome]|uniref:Uncharacterized protein n=1 Tax=marine sediment metagenome TaxID=412755 RepID=A0A0F9RHE3_9ZZZZ